MPGGRIAFTRCRPYRKNDQAFVEQKNGAVVRRIVGYRRLEGLEAAAALAQLYATVRLFVNFFQPSFKLAAKERDGARVRKRYHRPATPCQRLLADPRTPEPVRAAQTYARLDPVRLLSKMRMAQQRLVDIADRSGTPSVVAADPSLDRFLSGLRTAWRVKPAQPRKPSRSKNGAVGDRIPSPSSPKNCKRGLTKSPGGRAANCWSVCRRNVRGNIPISCCARCSAV